MNEIDGFHVIERTRENEVKSWTRAKKFPPFVFGISKNASLVHVVDRVEICWYDYGGMVHGKWTLVRRHRPRLFAHTVCQQGFRLEAKSSRTCRLPAADAVLCGRCQHDVATFGARKIPDRAERWRQRKLASVKLGCAVQGY